MLSNQFEMSPGKRSLAEGNSIPKKHKLESLPLVSILFKKRPSDRTTDFGEGPYELKQTGVPRREEVRAGPTADIPQ